MSLEQMNARISNPAQTLTIAAHDYGELVAYQAAMAASLQRCARALSLANPHGENEALAEIQNFVQGMANIAAGVLTDSVRLAMSQGLRIELDEGGPLRH